MFLSFLKKTFTDTIRVPISLCSDEVHCYVMLEMGTNLLTKVIRTTCNMRLMPLKVCCLQVDKVNYIVTTFVVCGSRYSVAL